MNQQNQLLMNQAAQAFQFGNLERADSILKHCIDINPKNWTAMHFRDHRLPIERKAEA